VPLNLNTRTTPYHKLTLEVILLIARLTGAPLLPAFRKAKIWRGKRNLLPHRPLFTMISSGSSLGKYSLTARRGRVFGEGGHWGRRLTEITRGLSDNFQR